MDTGERIQKKIRAKTKEWLINYLDNNDEMKQKVNQYRMDKRLGANPKYMKIVEDLKAEGLTDIGEMIAELDKRMAE